MSFAPIAGKKELKFSVADPASTPGSMEGTRSVYQALERCLKLGAGRDYGLRICASLESKSSCRLTAKKLFLSSQNHKTNSPFSLLRAINGATKRPQRSESPYVASRVLRPTCLVWTLVRQPAEAGSAQWDRRREKI